MEEEISKDELYRLLELKRELLKRRNAEVYKNSFKGFAKEVLSILTKDASQGFVPFEFNEAQNNINEAIEKQLKETGKVRALILKARQQGISTYTAGRVFWKTYYTPNTRSVVLAHDSATSDALFTMSKNYIDRMPEGIRPELIKSNAKEIKFAHNDSGYRLYTAGSSEAGRGTTPTILHASECAFWQHDEKILAGLFQGVSSSAGTEIILESTANGATGAFHRLWKATERGNTDYIAIFLPWFLTQEYRTPAPEGMVLSLEEKDLVSRFKLDEDQLFWRRLKTAESGELKFRQEYPATAEEAFIVSGSNVFNIEKLNSLECVPAKSKKRLDRDMYTWESSVEGPLSIWKSPDFDEKFIIGADVALGVGQDYSVATVMNKDREVVAMFRDNTIDPAMYGELLFYLGRYYNNSLIAVESNSMGIATLQKLKEMNYLNLYHQTKIANVSKEEGTRLGWRTTQASKQAVISNLKNWIENDDIAIYSTTIVDELLDYVSDESGKTNAMPGSYDDTVMALAITAEVWRTHADRLSNTNVGFDNKWLDQQTTKVWI
jgi:hypothetical protein